MRRAIRASSPPCAALPTSKALPLLTFAHGPDGTWTVSQAPYAALGTTPAPARWGVPLCLRQRTARSCRLLTEPSAVLALPGSGAFMPNAGGTGYYRFELPATDWDALIAQADRLPGGEALAVADSLEASFRAGRASPAQLIALSARLLRNRDSYAFAAATASLDKLAAEGLFDAPATAAYHAALAARYAPLLQPRSFDPRLGAYAREPSDQTSRRSVIVGKLVASGAAKPLEATLVAAAQGYLGGDAAALDPAWFEPAFSVALARGGLPLAKALVAAALGSENAQFRPIALRVVNASGNAEVATWLLDDLHDVRLRASERRTMIRTITETVATRELGYAYVQAHFDDLFGGSNGIFSASLPRMLTSFCSAARANEFARTLIPRLVGKTGALDLARTIERVRNCGILHDARAAELSKAVLGMR